MNSHSLDTVESIHAYCVVRIRAYCVE